MEDFPDIYLFNPTCEYAVANGTAAWQPNRLIKKMENDLDTLPLFFARGDDYVLVNKIPSENFVESLKNIGIEVPNFISLKNALNDKKFLSLPKNKLMPWGWSPAAHRLLYPLKPSCSKEFLTSPVSEWKPNYRDLYSKKFALEIQKNLLTELGSNIFLPENLIAKVCVTKKDFENAISRWRKIMVKAPWSASGRGLQPVTKTPVHPKVWEKLLGIVNEQGYAIAEPYLNKVLDMAIQFEANKGKISYIGTSFFNTDQKGQYKGNFVNGIPDNVNNEMRLFVENVRTDSVDPLISILEKSRLANEYEGFFGVDMLVYLDANKQLRANPCLEINVRQNMGLLSLNLSNILVNGKKGIFKTVYAPGENFLAFKNKMEKKYPLRLIKNKIDSGFLALTEAKNEKLFGAYLLV